MKTAMQELIHDHKHGKFLGMSVSKIDVLLQKYLEKEKQQIKAAYNGRDEDRESELDPHKYENSEEYYNQTFAI